MLASCLLLLSILVARSRADSFWLKRYFDAQILYTIILGALRLTLGVKSPLYALAYAELTALILIASVGVVREAKTRSKAGTILSCCSALAIGWMIYSALPGSVNWIVLMECALLVALGMSLAFAVPFDERRKTLGALAILWLALAIFDAGFLLHADWGTLNRWMPAWLVIGSFLWIAAFARTPALPEKTC